MKKLEIKTPVNVYDSSIITSRYFEDNIRSIINLKLEEFGYEDAEIIEIIAVGMAKRSGYGRYFDFVKLAVNDFDWTIRVNNHSSIAYDAYHDESVHPTTQSNIMKRLCLVTLKNGVERLVDELIDNEVVFKMETERSES